MDMSPQALESAARLLWSHRQAGTVIATLPDGLRPRTAAEGLAIQAWLPAVSGEAVVGWKIAATSQVGQQHINVPGPLPGRILRSFVHADGAALSLRGNRMRVAEAEFAFRLGRDLPAQAAPRPLDEVMDAVAALHPAFEVPDARLEPFTAAGEAQLLADDACCGLFVFGPAAPEGWRSLDLAAHAVVGEVRAADGTVRARHEGVGRAVLGDPRRALAWLVNTLGAQGIDLPAGLMASCGTCMTPMPVAPGDQVHADFGGLGRVQLRCVP